jgi:uncharacterized protein (TIRG00374 family)
MMELFLDNDELTTETSKVGQIWRWLNIIATFVLIGWGVWYLVREVTLAEIGTALLQANISYILGAIAAFLLTVLIKAWRWQLLYYPPEQAPPFTPLFWAMMTGQFVNVTVPFLRLGEIARIYSLSQQTGIGKMRSLGTLVIEKTLDLATLLLTISLLLPLVALSDFVVANEVMLGVVTAVLALFLYLLAYRTDWFVQLLQRLCRYLPGAWGQRVSRLIISGLDGLTALRNQRVVLLLVGSSLLVGFLSVVTPWLLLVAFGLPLGLVAAALLHVGATVASVPATTPAKIGVVQFVVIFILSRFNVDNEAVIWSFALVYHLVTILPQILLGLVAAWRTSWKWSMLTKQQLSSNTP